MPTQTAIPASPEAVLNALEACIAACLEFERRHASITGSLAAEAGASARNLLHYLRFRQEDLRWLQGPLAELGLSSLGRNEPHVLANLTATARALAALLGRAPSRWPEAPITLSRGRTLLETRTERLLGQGPCGGRAVRIMVTLPTEAAEGPDLARALLAAGMDCARINTAHDTPEHWRAMTAHIRRASAEIGRACRVCFDLAGPKLRTGAFEPGPEVVVLRPRRTESGLVREPAHAVLRPMSCPPAPVPGPHALGPPDPAGCLTELPIPDELARVLEPGDVLETIDTRARHRLLRVVARHPDGRLRITVDRTTYLSSHARLRLLRARGRPDEGRIGSLPPVRQAAEVRLGDRVILDLGRTLGRPAPPAGEGVAGEPAVVTTTLPEAFAHVRVGHGVWFDDGRVGAVIRGIEADEHARPRRIELEITHASPTGDRIRADKGINLPDSEIPLSGLTPADAAALPTVAACADMVGLSFVRSPDDLTELRCRLGEAGGSDLPVILKIETRQAFENLPLLLLALLRAPGGGIMIARGDLAVECGYERLAEVQEEILWLCEAVHIPVIWATQVLESLAKRGRVSRAEVTDAAMAERAEGVMLNKGPYIVNAVRFLDGVLRRMAQHQDKKRPMLRALNVARRSVLDG